MYGLNNGIPVSLKSTPSFGIAPQNQLTAAIQSLFWDGSQGWWYDDDDTSTMLQVTGGNLSFPVTAVEQFVGLQLDKSQGAPGNQGPDIIVNGNYSAGTANWTAFGTNLPTLSAANNQLTVSLAGPSGSAGAYQAITTVIGKWYIVRAPQINSTGVSPRLRVGTTIDGSENANVTVSNTLDSGAIFIATSTTTYISLRVSLNTAGVDVIWGPVSTRELPGNHRYAPASGNRPIWSKRVNLLTKTEQFDDAAWAKGAGVSVTNQKTISFTSGGGTEFVRQSVTLLSGVAYSVYVRARSVSGNTTLSIDAQNIQNFPGISLTTTFQEFVRTLTMTGARSWIDLQLGGAGVIEIDYIDLRPANQATGTIPLYQRVNTSTDYDTNGFPGYLKADGIDDFLQTNSIDFNTVTSDGQARRNLLLNPTQFDDAYWTKARSSITANATTAPDGTLTADKLIEDTTAANSHNVNVNQSFLAGVSYTLSIYAKAAERGYVLLLLPATAFSSTTFATFSLSDGAVTQSGNSPTASAISIGDGWWRVSISKTATNTLSGLAEAARTSITGTDSGIYTGDGTSGIYIWGAQLEVGSTATAFQNIGTDKVTLCAGLRKLSDAALGVATELSAATASNNGAFALEAPAGASPSFNFESKGTTLTDNTAQQFIAPITQTVTGIGDIAAARNTIRIGGVEAGVNTATQGTGNYGNYPAYFFRRGGTANPFNGYEYSNIAVGKLLTASQLASLEQYTYSKTINPDGAIYATQAGFSWNSATNPPNSTTYTGSRFITPTHEGMRRCLLLDNGTVNYYLDPNDSTKKADGTAANLTGADGQVMVEIPAFYTKRTVVGTTTTWEISSVPATGFTLHPAFTKDGVDVPFRYYGAYDACVYDVSASAYISGLNWDNNSGAGNGVEVDVTASTGDVLASVSGVYPMVGLQRAEFRTIAANRGSGWRQVDWTLWSAVQLLYLIEYQTFFSQNVLGAGNTGTTYAASSGTQSDNGGSEAGKSNSIGNASSNVTTGASSASRGVAWMSYRGIENFYGNAWNWADGVIVNPDGTASAGQGDWWFTNNSADFSDSVRTNMTQITNVAATASGFISAIASSDNFFVGTSTSGGSSTTFLTDQLFASTAADRVVHVGGAASNGANAGAFCVDATNGASDRNRRIGARLAF